MAVLVLLLTGLSVSPQLHAELHDCGHDHDHPAPASIPDSEASCVVTLFGQGITAGLAPLALPAPSSHFQSTIVTARREIFFCPPRYLHQPERGPPLV